MITQGLLDVLSQMIGQVISLFPPLPDGWNAAVAAIGSFGGSMGARMSNLGIVIPWASLWTVVTWWLGALGFWAAMLVVRLVLWIAGR